MVTVSIEDERDADLMDIIRAVRELDPERLQRLTDYAEFLKEHRDRH
jgi:hypothetical protein